MTTCSKKDILIMGLCIVFVILVLGAAGSRGRHHAQMVICQANLKHLVSGSLAYAGDNEGKLFFYSLIDGLWITPLEQYTANDKSRYCPSTIIQEASSSPAYSFGSSRDSWIWYWSGMPEPDHGSYGFNAWFYSSLSSSDERYYHTVNEVFAPSNTPVFGDSIWIDAGPRDTDTCPTDFNLEGDNLNGGVMSRYIINRHGPQINIGFIDGHQQAVELGALWSLQWNKEFVTTPWMTRTDGSPIYQ